ncbi:hypothetical protein JXA88_18755 [Candidatus Fermentibacteria bacterium]|nr:hypothetical protein [Candidatus Fermentibacteria bacterium]
MRTHTRCPMGLLLPLLVGLALRLLAASGMHAPWGDNGATILELANNLSEGKGYTTLRVWTFHGSPRQIGQPEGNRQPLLPLLTAVVRVMGGASFRSAQGIPLVVGGIVIVLSYGIGAAIGGAWAGSAAAWLSALDPPQIYFSAQIEDQILFTALFLGLVLWCIRHGGDTRPRPWVPGLLLGLLYLSRANGLLVAIAFAVVGLRRRQFRHVAMVAAVACAVAMPWFVRNAHAFGNPLHTDNSYFLWSDDFWSVFSVRAASPSIGNYFAQHSVADIIARWVKGAYLSLEGFLVGNIFRGEPFARDSLILPVAAALFGLRRHRGQMAVAGIAFVFHFLTVAWHAHGTYRYFLPFYAVIFAGAGAGLVEAARRWIIPLPARQRAAAVAAAVGVLLLPLTRPLVMSVGRTDRPTHEEAMQVVEWIRRTTGRDTVIMGFPVVEKYLYLYQRPTVMTPYGPLEDVWRVVCGHDVDYLVVSAEQLRWLPALREYWLADGERIFARSIPPHLHEEMTSSGGMFVVYRIDREALCG